MRHKQKHKCWACGKTSDHFFRVKRKVNFVKVFQCLPRCRFSFDIERMERKVFHYLSQPSPWIPLIGNKFPNAVKIIRQTQE